MKQPRFLHLSALVRLGALCLASAVQADWTWLDFNTASVAPTAIDGIYAYQFPKVGAGKTSLHTAVLTRNLQNPLEGGGDALLSFVLDGLDYPAAGVGFMFPDATPVDLRNLRTIRLKIRADRARRVRLSLASRVGNSQALSEVGISLGKDTLVGTSTLDWEINAQTLSYPKWDTTTKEFSPEEVKAATFALQFAVSCESEDGSCSKDIGYLKIDQVALDGVGDAWPVPASGNCNDTLPHFLLADFRESPVRTNRLGGAWYAYTDATSDDPQARGASTVTTQGGGWVPDSVRHEAALEFNLVRLLPAAPYSGYAAVETQLGPSTPGNIPLMDLPGARAIGFDLEYGAGFSESALGGVVFHAKKGGADFAAGRDHQMRVPWTSASRRWCLPLDSLRQPSWVEWGVPFTPTGLLALAWEVKLKEMAHQASGSFKVRNIVVYGAKGATGIARKAGAGMPVLVQALDLQGHPLRRQTAAGAGLVLERYSDGSVRRRVQLK